MEIPKLLVSLCVVYPLAVVYLYKINPGKATPYLVPRLLNDGSYSKKTFRKAGIAWFVLSLWLLTTGFTVPAMFPLKWVESNYLFMGIFMFGLPIFSIMFLLVSFYYLFVGIFSRKQAETSSFKSVYVEEKIDVAMCMKKLKRYTFINVTSFLLMVASITIQSILSIETNGYLALLDALFLGGFIFTIGPIKDNAIKTSMGMGDEGRVYRQSNEDDTFKKLFYWNHSSELRKLYQQMKKDQSPKDTAPNSKSIPEQNA